MVTPTRAAAAVAAAGAAFVGWRIALHTDARGSYLPVPGTGGLCTACGEYGNTIPTDPKDPTP